MIAVSHILLKLEKPYQDEIISENGLKLFLDTRFKPEWNATSFGTVESIPPHLSYMPIKAGDNVAFSFRVVDQRDFAVSDSNAFFPTHENETHCRWTNSKGHIMQKGFFVKTSGFKEWYGSLLDGQGGVISGVQGHEGEVERWLSQFKFGYTTGFKFRNMIDHDGEIYWKARPEHIFAKKVDNKIIPISDDVICSTLKHKVFEHKNEKGVMILAQSKEKAYIDRGKAIHDDKITGVKKGDTVSFDSRYGAKYNLWGNDYYFIKRDFVNGKWVN